MSRTGHDYYKDRDQDMFMGSVRDGTCPEQGQKPELWIGSWKIRRTAGKCSFRDRYWDRMWIMDGKKSGTCALLRNSNMDRNMDREKDEL